MSRKSLQTKLEAHAAGPLYKKVEKQILQCLAEGEWKAGDRLPTESQLAERFGVAHFTLRAGIRELVAANILIRRQGIGTFVARHNRQRQRYQFSHLFRNDGTQIFPGRELVSFGREIAPGHAASILRLQSEARPEIYRVECLLTVDGEPAAVMSIALPVRLFNGLTTRAIRNSEENLYAVYQDVCGVNVIRIEESVYGAVAKGPIARAVRIPVNSPLLQVERIAYTYNDVPVEYRVRYVNATEFHYRSAEGGV